MKTQEQIDTEALIKERREAFFEAMENLTEVAPTKTLFGVIAQAEKEVKSLAYANSDKPRISKEVGRSAYGYQIDTACKPTDSIRMAAMEHEEDVDLILSLRNDKWNHNKTMITLHQDFFDDKTKAIPTKELKIGVRNATTLSAGLNRVFSYQKLEQKVAELERRADDQEEKLRMLEGGNIVNTMDINNIKSSTNLDGANTDTLLQKVITLRSLGYTYKEISSLVGKGESTVKRWVYNYRDSCIDNEVH